VVEPFVVTPNILTVTRLTSITFEGLTLPCVDIQAPPDTTPPTFGASGCPGSLSVAATSNDGAVVALSFSATDNVGVRTTTVTVGGADTSASGGSQQITRAFPIGTTNVTARAFDAANNVAVCSLNVTVTLPVRPLSPLLL
jgi:hypothetical protein